MINFLRFTLLVWVLAVSQVCLAGSSTVYHTVNINDSSDKWMSISLRAGDELILRIEGFDSVQSWNATEIIDLNSSLNKNVKYNVSLDSRYFLPNTQAIDKCKGKNTIGIRTDKNSRDAKCVEIPFHVIKNGGRYTVINVTSDISSKPVVFSRSLVNKSSSWALNVSGGFFGSGLTNKKYYADTIVLQQGDPVNNTPDTTEQRIARNKDTEDDFSLGMAAFLHTCYEDQGNGFWSKVAPDCISFGLGLSDQSSDLNYLPGISWKLGDEFYLTMGGQMAKVDALPRGLKVGDKIESANDLTTLDSKYETAFAITISYKFLGGSTKQTFTNAISPSSE